MSTHFSKNFKRLDKDQKITFWRAIWSKIAIGSDMSKLAPILNENLNYWGHLSNFKAVNTILSGSLKIESIPKQFINNPINTWKKSRFFFKPQSGQNMGIKFAKRVRFWAHFRSTSPNFASWAKKNIPTASLKQVQNNLF